MRDELPNIHKSQLYNKLKSSLKHLEIAYYEYNKCPIHHHTNDAKSMCLGLLHTIQLSEDEIMFHFPLENKVIL